MGGGGMASGDGTRGAHLELITADVRTVVGVAVALPFPEFMVAPWTAIITRRLWLRNHRGRRLKIVRLEPC